MKDETIALVKQACCHERTRLRHLRKIIITGGFNTAQAVTIDGKRYHKLIKTMHDISRLVKSLGKLIRLCEDIQDERKQQSGTLPT